MGVSGNCVALTARGDDLASPRTGSHTIGHLASFEAAEARWFFGRDALTAELLERLDQRSRSGGLQVVVAPSGAGKSSLLRAGLIAALAGITLAAPDADSSTAPPRGQPTGVSLTIGMGRPATSW